MNLKKLIICLFVLVIFLPIVAAFNIDVDCPDSASPGETVSCRFILDTSIPDGEVFGAQFVINAPGFTAGTPFFTPTLPVLGDSGGLGAQTLLFKLAANGQTAGEVATFNLIAGQQEGAFDVSLSDLVSVSGSTPDSIHIIAEESSCIPKPEICNDGVDNDCDLLTDCADPDCQIANTAGADICWEATCNDGIDNDRSISITLEVVADCADSDCAGKIGPEGVTCCQSKEDCAGTDVCQGNICVGVAQDPLTTLLDSITAILTGTDAQLQKISAIALALRTYFSS
jgi:hypothetical protein